MQGMRHQRDAVSKVKVAFEALKREKSLSQLAVEFQVHPNQIRHWQDKALEALHGIFSRGSSRDHKERETLKRSIIGQSVSSR